MRPITNWLLGRIQSFRYAFAGLRTVARQRNTHIHVFVALIVVICGLLWHLTEAEWLSLTLTITLVIVLEAVNSAIEATVDLASPAIHPLAKQAKDIGATAVLLAAFGAVVVALIIFGPRLVDLAHRVL